MKIKRHDWRRKFETASRARAADGDCAVNAESDLSCHRESRSRRRAVPKNARPGARAARAANDRSRHAGNQRAGDATEIARESYAAGTAKFIAVGGDGTSYEIVNGLFPEAARTRLRLWLFSLGHGKFFSARLQRPRSGTCDRSSDCRALRAATCCACATAKASSITSICSAWDSPPMSPRCAPAASAARGSWDITLRFFFASRVCSRRPFPLRARR